MELLTLILLIIVLFIILSFIKEHFIKKTAKFILKTIFILLIIITILVALYNNNISNPLTETGATIFNSIKTNILG